MDTNKVILIGNVGAEPEVNYIGRTQANARFPLGTSDDDRGTTDWHRIACLRFDLAQKAEQYVHKGTRVSVEGTLRYREYVKEGQRLRYAEIEAQKIDIGIDIEKTKERE